MVNVNSRLVSGAVTLIAAAAGGESAPLRLNDVPAAQAFIDSSEVSVIGFFEVSVCVFSINTWMGRRLNGSGMGEVSHGRLQRHPNISVPLWVHLRICRTGILSLP